MTSAPLPASILQQVPIACYSRTVNVIDLTNTGEPTIEDIRIPPFCACNSLKPAPALDDREDEEHSRTVSE